MKKILFKVLLITIFAIVASGCNEESIINTKEDEDSNNDNIKKTIIHKEFDPPLIVKIPEIIDNDTIRFEFEDDTVFNDLDFIFVKEINVACPSDFYGTDFYYWIGIDLGENKMADCDNYYPCTPYQIPFDSIISDSLRFNKIISLYFDAKCNDYKYNCTKIDDMKLNYYGIKLKNGVNNYFGWIRFRFEANAIMLLEYAYQTDNNKTISAGQIE